LNSPENTEGAGPQREQPSSLATRRSLTHRKFRWFLVVAWAGLIFYLSTSSFGVGFTESTYTSDAVHYFMRKAAHMAEYAVLCLLLYAAFLETDDFEWRPRLAVRSVVISGIYALTDEYHQTFAEGRTAAIIDCGIDIAGAALATLVILAWDRRRTRRTRTFEITGGQNQ